MKTRWILCALLVAFVAVGVQSRAESPTPEEITAACSDVTKIEALMADTTPEEAAAIADKLIKAAIAKGGSEGQLKTRLAEVSAACIATSGANASAVAAALTKAAGADNETVVVAAIVVAARVIGADVEGISAAAVGAASDKDAAQAAAKAPGGVLGLWRTWKTERVAQRWVEQGESTSTTTTTTTTTTTPTPTEVGTR